MKTALFLAVLFMLAGMWAGDIYRRHWEPFAHALEFRT